MLCARTQAALSGAGQLAVSSDLHAALAAAADQAAALAQALPDASAAAPQAVALAAGQLSQSLESVTAAIAAASTSTGEEEEEWRRLASLHAMQQHNCSRRGRLA